MGTTHNNFLSVRRRAAQNARRKLDFQLLLLYVGMKSKLKRQTAEAARLDQLIWANLEDIGYGR
jgi:hypothetical protein